MAIYAAMQAIERVRTADRRPEKGATAISAAECALWLRAASDLFTKHLAVSVSSPTTSNEQKHSQNQTINSSYYGAAQGLRIIGNKGIHELIFPAVYRIPVPFLNPNPRPGQFPIGPIISKYNYAWLPLSEWEPFHEKEPRPEDKLAFNEYVAKKPVVSTLASALLSYQERALLAGINLSDIFDIPHQPTFVQKYFG